MKAICFVCGSKGANSILHVKPRSKGAYFSFLESHDPPRGAKLPNGEGVISACLVCYAFLNQQWDSFEKSKTPLVKRLYWLKRTDNRSFTGAELNVQGEYVAQIMGVQYNCGLSGNISPFDYGSHTGISCSIKDALPSPSNDSNLSSSIDDRPMDRAHLSGVLDLSISPKKPKSHSKKPQKNEDSSVANASKALGSSAARTLGSNNSKSVGCEAISSAKQKNSSIVCYVCRKTCPASLARFVYAIRYSDDEPYFPFILGLAEPPGAMALTKNGVTQVCSECRKTLSRQWRIFESRKVTEMERVYKINDSPIVVEKTAKENGDGGGGGLGSACSKSGGSACYLCGEVTLTSSMFTLRTREEGAEVEGSGIVLPFIEKLKCPLGARPINSRGAVLVCSLCHDHIRTQWQRFEESNLPLERREYMLRPFLNANSSFAFPGSVDKNETVSSAEKKNPRRTPFLRDGQTPLKEPIQFAKDSLHPFLLDQRSSDAGGTIGAFSDAASFRMPFPSPLLLKMDCNKNMMTKADGSTCNGHGSSAKEPIHPNSDVVHTRCFLCNHKCRRTRSDCKGFVSIYDRPDVARSSEDTKTCFFRPFFPFLSTVTPSGGEEALRSDEGRFDVCYACYHNLIGQWFSFERSSDLEEQNRWLRKYRHRCFTCCVCKQGSDRQKVDIIPVEEESLGVLGGVDGLVEIEGSNCALLCSSCINRLRLNGEQNGRRVGKTKRSAGKAPKTGTELVKLNATDELHLITTASNSSSQSSSASLSAAAPVKDGDRQSVSSSSSSSSSPTDADIKTTTIEMSSSALASAEGRESVCSNRRRRKRGGVMMEDEEMEGAPSHHLFHRPTPTPPAGGGGGDRGWTSSSSNSYLDALRRMTMETTNTSQASSPFTHHHQHYHDVKRSESVTNECPTELNSISSANDSNLTTNDLNAEMRSFHADDSSKTSNRRNGLLVPKESKTEAEDDDGDGQCNPSIISSSNKRQRCSSSMKMDDVSSASSTMKKTKSPSRSAVFPSSPLPQPPPASDISSIGCNGFIPPPPPPPPPAPPSSCNDPHRIINPTPSFHPSLIRLNPHHLSSSSFLSTDALFLHPQLIAGSSSSSTSSVLGFLHPPPPPPSHPPLPSSSSAIRWDEYLVMQRLQHQQQLMSSPSPSPYAPSSYPSSLFPPPPPHSLIHPLLQPSAAIASPFLFAPDRSSASISLPSAFDLSNLLSRDIYQRRECHDAMEATSDASEMECWKNGAQRNNRGGGSNGGGSNGGGGGNGGGSGEEDDEEEERGNDLYGMREGRFEEESRKNGRCQGRKRKMECQRKGKKPSFHRPFLENCSEEEEEDELEVEKSGLEPLRKEDKDVTTGKNKDDVDLRREEGLLKTENFSDGSSSPLIRSNALIESNRLRLITELNRVTNGHLTRVAQPKNLMEANGYGPSLLSKEEILNAALSLISLQSPRVLSFAKGTTGQRGATTDLELEARNNGSSRCHWTTNNDDVHSEETYPCKRLRLDVNDHRSVTSNSSSKPIKESQCSADRQNKKRRRQSLPVDRLLSSPPSKPPDDNDDDDNEEEEEEERDGERERPHSHTSSSSSPASHPSLMTSLRILQWPGIETIIESYQQHCRDYSLERSFLIDQGLQSAHTRQVLLSTTETFSAKIVELTRIHEDLISERAQLQSSFDSLTSCLRRLQ